MEYNGRTKVANSVNESLSLFKIQSKPISLLKGDQEDMIEYSYEHTHCDTESGSKDKEETDKKEFLLFDPEPLTDSNVISPSEIEFKHDDGLLISSSFKSKK